MNTYNANALVTGFFLLLGLVLAIFLGDSVGTGRYSILAVLMVVGLGIPLLLKLAADYWVLILVGVTFTSRSPLLPVPLHVNELLTMAATLGFTLQVIMRRVNLKVGWDIIDYLIALNFLWLIVTFIKNPVGVAFLGSEMVGGRKYLTLGFAFCAYYVLSRSHLPPRWARPLPIILAFAWALPHALIATSVIFPDLGPVIGRVYAIEAAEAATGQQQQQGSLMSEGRILGLERTAVPIFLAMCAYYPPITFITPLHPVRLMLFLCLFVATGLAGFRSFLLAFVGYMVAGTLLRGRTRDLIPLGTIAALGVAILAISVQSGFPVPKTIQRALSILPLGWDPEAVQDAQNTADWRVDMWRDAWNDPNYFKDKVFGDGFGYTYQEMLLFANQMEGYQGLMGGASYEMFIIRGSLHNGPLSSLRYGGFIGLILLSALMITTAIYAVKVVRASTNTVYMPIALFTAIPLVYEVFAFYIIFGAYDQHLSQYFIGVGMLNLINRSLPEPVTVSSRQGGHLAKAAAALPSAAITVPTNRIP